MSVSENNTLEVNHTDFNIDSLEMLVRMHLDNLCPEGSRCDWEDYVQVFKQSCLFVLIIGCWLYPMTILNKNEKSQLLLFNIGIASDILEFLESAGQVRMKLIMNMMDTPILLPITFVIGTWSLLQFTLIFKPNNSQGSITLGRSFYMKRIFANTAFLEVLFSLLLMDIPFLVFQLLLIFYFKCFNNSIIFFAAKNTLMIVIQFYRIRVVQNEARSANATENGRCLTGTLRDSDQHDPEAAMALLENGMRSLNDETGNNSCNNDATKRLSMQLSNIPTDNSSNASEHDSTSLEDTQNV
ncbi:unnamed protein product [Meganyctiphanes norvegica]|uniref:Transmembrane protein 26 n=1 Tax=Meganyctiphanes norvegica TaxID=48144 RepID=A0AAV2Q3H2_MEGNR